MTDEHHELAREFLALAVVAGGEPLLQASALLTAATVVIEREVGRPMAPAALMALVEPTLAAWQAPAPAQRR